MIIAVTMRVATGGREARDAISHDWVRLLAKYRVTPLLVPNQLPDPEAYVDAFAARGLL